MRATFHAAALLALFHAAPAMTESVASDEYWTVSIDLPAVNMSDVESRMKVRGNRADRFRAHSRPGALRDFQGFWRSLMGRLTRAELRRGAWLHLVDGRIHDDGTVTGTFKSMLLRRPLRLECPGVDEVMQCRLQDNGETVGAATIRPASGWELPIRDYSALLHQVEATAAEHIFSEALLEDDGWRGFISRLRDDLARVADDPDMLVAWFSAIDMLPVSHVFLQRGGRGIDDMLSSRNDSGRALLDLEWSGSTAIIRIPSFGVPVDIFADQLAEAFAQVELADALVLDLRGNSGGNLSSMLVAAHLIDGATPAGYFVSRAWWRLYEVEPTPELAIKHLPIIEEPDLALFFRHLNQDGGVQGRVRPRSPQFTGPVYVLIDRRTASASEPLVWHLQHTGATLVGEPTAGAMLSSNRFELGDGWYLILPVADYYTANGERLEGRGVVPDYSTSSGEALDHALDLIHRRANTDLTAQESDST